MPATLRIRRPRDRRRAPSREARFAPELLEARDLAAALPGPSLPPKSLAGPAAVSILFPVFEPAKAIAPGPKAAPAGILFPVFTPGGYTNSCLLTTLPAVSY